MGKLHFVTGPVRSGKSRYALDLAKGWGDQVVYAATYRLDPEDGEMVDRVRRHREERPATWRTLEAPGDLAAALAHLEPPPGGLHAPRQPHREAVQHQAPGDRKSVV